MVPNQEIKSDVRPTPVLLVVEDEPLIRMDLADCLRLDGFTVIEAGGPAEARAAVSSGAPIVCVLTDIHMPRSDDGLELLRWLAEQRPDLPVFVASGVSDSVELAKAQNRSVIAAFEKPYRPNVIVAEVRALLARASRA